MTAGQCRFILKDLPPDMPIIFQRQRREKNASSTYRITSYGIGRQRPTDRESLLLISKGEKGKY
ncbi:hypothetical protein ES708_15970 [subsurface metagenome]